jgi:raffinose/stachyose/melibiose transport system permease protein
MDDRNVSPVIKYSIYLLMLLFSALAIFPLLWLFAQSLKTTQEYLTTSKLTLPRALFFGNYSYTWRMGKFGTLFLNSVFYTFITVTSVVLLALMAGFAFSFL